jgi:hypothetical protein
MNPTQEGFALETMVTAWNFIKWDKVRQFVKSLQRRIAKATNLLYIAGRFTPASESLSRMRRKLQVRFLGDKGGAIRLRYPTKQIPYIESKWKQQINRNLKGFLISDFGPHC